MLICIFFDELKLCFLCLGVPNFVVFRREQVLHGRRPPGNRVGRTKLRIAVFISIIPSGHKLANIIFVLDANFFVHFSRDSDGRWENDNFLLREIQVFRKLRNSCIFILFALSLSDSKKFIVVLTVEKDWALLKPDDVLAILANFSGELPKSFYMHHIFGEIYNGPLLFFLLFYNILALVVIHIVSQVIRQNTDHMMVIFVPPRDHRATVYAFQFAFLGVLARNGLLPRDAGFDWASPAQGGRVIFLAEWWCAKLRDSFQAHFQFLIINHLEAHNSLFAAFQRNNYDFIVAHMVFGLVHISENWARKFVGAGENCVD